MISQEMLKLGTSKSVIRELAGFGAQRAAIVGAENVLDFSLGNPSVPAPKEVQDAIVDIIKNYEPKVYHSYSSGAGHDGCRTAIAENLNKRYGTNYSKDNFIMTCGAAASLNITIKALVAEPGDEIMVLAPFFPEYTVFIAAQGGKQVLVPCKDDMQLNVEGIKEALTPKTRGIIVNSPNNPSGVVYTKEEMQELCDLLVEKEKEYGHPIYIIADEPYRELVLIDGLEVPFIPNMYKNTVVCYSWSKSLSLPGERIGYVLVPNNVDDEQLIAACGGAARALGFVCAPTLFQLVIERCVNVEPDLTVYKKNRDLLYDGLTKLGYNVAKPAGAFYLFIESPDGDSEKFSEKAKEYDMLVVPGTGFGSKAHMRLSYCVETEKCEKSLEVFEKLMKKYK
ncbi:pyridoxal phosphate-dependent aminotransferase [Peptostreptococcus equinus]|uniref:Pyridoxal phosphate-dependent aminotransferase n=1 Tax=Peptostreptococcus equinus TaxID=3003601 RepID=A0ABY7JPP2_9FIRM|nr:pyridoxal phosphate-dependent aminotransferase [Peptostreptococcus sp. CBA3647]WAW15341.1 pyridoxal phosphate-dependent aminotransferase [Peptostreptococcus sp. CBA3647]